MDLKGNQVIAVDFDGTLCKQAWPEIGEENEILIEHLKEQQAAGARLILWTNREGDLLEEAVEWCKARGLTFDTVNANLPELIDLYKNDCRKINADIYIDDKAVNPNCFCLFFYFHEFPAFLIFLYHKKATHLSV